MSRYVIKLVTPTGTERYLCANGTSTPTLYDSPFCGSGPVPRACKDRGIRCVAAELSEAYCEVTAERLSQNILDFGGVA